MKSYINNLSVKSKIAILIAINLISILFLGAITYYGFSKNENMKNQIIINDLAAIHQMNADMMHDALRADVYNAILTDSNDVENASIVRNDLKEHINLFNSSLDELNKAKLSAQIKAQVVEVRKPLEAYINASQGIVETALNNKVDFSAESGKLQLEQYKEVFNNLAIVMEGLSEMIEKESLHVKDESTHLTELIYIGVAMVLLLIVSFTLFIGIYIAKIIAAPITLSEQVLSKLSSGEITNTVSVTTTDETGKMLCSLNGLIENLNNVKIFVNEVGNGNFDTSVAIFNNHGEIFESLNKMKSDLQTAAVEDYKRNWSTEGMARFGDILRDNSGGLDVLANNILTNLIRYIGANQGGLFVVNDVNKHKKFLELIAAYAWDKKKYITMEFEQGEGLVGQAWLEQDMIYLTDIPNDYISITSGLGKANPGCIIIVPLTVNGETFGVIELASFHTYEAYQLEFLKKLAESIASTISNAKVNERTKILLEQSQQQTEEMRAQEEEMRQNMEEMQATSEESERKSQNYESAIQRLNQEIKELSEENLRLKS